MTTDSITEEYTKLVLEIGKLKVLQHKLELQAKQLETVNQQIDGYCSKASELEALFLKLKNEVTNEGKPTSQE